LALLLRDAARDKVKTKMQNRLEFHWS